MSPPVIVVTPAAAGVPAMRLTPTRPKSASAMLGLSFMVANFSFGVC